jgi:hypothetical protein
METNYDAKLDELILACILSAIALVETANLTGAEDYLKLVSLVGPRGAEVLGSELSGNLPLGIAGILVASISLAYLAFRPSRWNLRLVLVFCLLSVMWLFIASYGAIFCIVGVLDNGKESHDALTCTYLSLVTWTTVGYGEVVPMKAARLWAASEALTGYVTMIVFISTIARVIKQRFPD